SRLRVSVTIHPMALHRILSPRIGLMPTFFLPLTPNAGRQALEIARAKNERRLFPVACTRLFGWERPRFSLAWSPPASWRPFLRDTPAHTRGSNPCARLANHLIRLEEEGRREGEAERLGGLEVDNQLELMGALHRQVGRFSAFQDFVHKDRRALAPVVGRHAIAQQDPRRG